MPGWARVGWGRAHPWASLAPEEGSRECGLASLQRWQDLKVIFHIWFTPGAAVSSPGSVTAGDWKWQCVLRAEQFIRGEIRFRVVVPAPVLMDEVSRRLRGPSASLDGRACFGLTLEAHSPLGPAGLRGPLAPREAQPGWGGCCSGDREFLQQKMELRLHPEWP